MTSLVTGDALKAAVKDETFVKHGDANAVETVKYDFRLGSRVLKSFYGLPKEIDTIPEENRWIEPGEVVFVLTQEELHLPANMIAMLSPKRAITHRGIMVLGGFAIDPGYSGLLWFGLHNFASTRFPLRSGTKLIAAMFYELSDEEASHFKCTEIEAVTDFPDDLIDLIKNYRPVELKGVLEELAATKSEVLALKKDFGDDKSWREDFKRDLGEHNRQLGQLIDGLREEKDARKAEDKRIGDLLDQKSNLFLGVRWGTIGVISVVGVIVTAVVTAIITLTVSSAMQPRTSAVASVPSVAPAPAKP